MTTENVLLSGQWQQITTGTETKLLQCLSGKFALCESVDEPPAEQPWHIFSEVVITPPSIVWVK
ncbi:hypothetical protein ACSFCX_25895, partial [Yokenella regensburgei]|uniref:hypothetical protein n=1 Tax=Yokenella regensburgei TaxID=158877 RepID=UPI003ED87978